jgi:hypothetical protein
MRAWCDILNCVCGSSASSCEECHIFKRKEIIENGDDENYGVGEYGRCSKFGTEFPINEVCLTECPDGVMRRCTDYYLASQEKEKRAAALVFASQHQVIASNSGKKKGKE